jgi:hypothetical protein
MTHLADPRFLARQELIASYEIAVAAAQRRGDFRAARSLSYRLATLRGSNTTRTHEDLEFKDASATAPSE